MKLHALVKPGAKNREETVTPGETYQITTREPAIDGRANTRAIELLAEHLNVSKTKVKIVSGAGSRYKTFEIESAL